MKTVIWIINEYAGSPYHGMEYRHYYMGKELNRLNNDVTIISSSYSHLFKNLPQKKEEQIDGLKYLWIKTFNYKNSHNKKRVFKWFLFMFKILFLPLKLSKPKVIIISTMAPFSIIPAWILSKFYKAKLIYEVKDIWPLSLIELGGLKKNNPVIVVMRWCEKFALKKSDIIISNLSNYGEHIEKNVGLNKSFEWISNGIDLNELDNIKELDINILDKIPKNKFIVGYTGTMGIANALESFLEVSELLEDKKEIFFLLVGDGQEKEKLIKKYGDKENVLFLNSIEKRQIQSILKLFSICFLGWNDENIYRYGTSANKMFDYMYSGKAILNAYSGGGDLIKIADCGITVKANDSVAIKNGILEFYNMELSKRINLGENGKRYVLENFTYKELTKKMNKLINTEELFCEK